MNTPDNDLLARLRTDFQREVESVPEVDLAAGVAGRARRIHRQRRLVGAAVAAIVVAVVPVSVLEIRGLTDAGRAPAPADQDTNAPPPTDSTPPATTQTDTTPRLDEHAVQLRLAQLPEGEAPTIPYLLGKKWYDGDTSVGIADHPFTTIPFGEHVFAVYTSHDGEQSYSVDDGPQQAFGGAWYGRATPGPNDSILWFSTDAYENTSDNATRPDNPTLHTLTVDSTGSAQEATASFGDLDDAVVTLAGFVGDDVIASVESTYTAPPRSRERFVIRFPVSDPSAFERVDGFLAVTAVDRQGQHMSGLTRGNGSGSRCSSVVDVDTLQPRWSSCSWAPVEFSPDGSKVYADVLNASGPDKHRYAVLDVDTGEVQLVLSVANEPFGLGYATFEDDETLLVSVDQRGLNAIVRCAITTGECETATPPERLTTGDDLVFETGAAPSKPAYE